MPKPSDPKGFRNEFNNRSPRHDDMHLWLSDEKHRMQLVTICYYKHIISKFKCSSLDDVKKLVKERPRSVLNYEIERPVYSGPTYFLGVVDAIVTFNLTNILTNDKVQVETSYNDKEICYTLLCEFKPEIPIPIELIKDEYWTNIVGILAVWVIKKLQSNT